MQTIYDTDEESYEILEPFSSKVQEEINEEIFEQVETKEPSLEKEEAIEHTSAQEYNNLFIELSPLKQDTSGLLEDNIVVYDEFSNLDDSEDEEDCLPQKNICLDPVEKEEVILVETYLPKIHNQALFQDPYAHLLKEFKEGIKVLRSSVLPKLRRLFSIDAKKQKEWEWPCVSYMLKVMSKDQSWNHLIDWMYWKREFVS